MKVEIEIPVPELSSEVGKIRENYTALKEANKVVNGWSKAVQGYMKANETMCAHPNAKSYQDYGGGYSSDCAD
jgi:hypothetical protein